MDVDTPSEAPPAENGTADSAAVPEAEAIAVKETTPEPPPNPALTRYHELWKEVQASPSDFNAWTNVISSVEKLDIENIRTVYDQFLASWPLCYGYWKKYADAELRHGSFERAIQVYERAVAATPYSIDMWAHFSTFQQTVPEASPDSIRSIFERAVAAVGTDYLSHSVWDKYLAFEVAQGNKLHVAALYSRVLGMPLRDLDKYYQGLRTFVQATPLLEIMSEEEAGLIRSQLEEEHRQVTAAQAVAAAAAAAEATATADAEAATAAAAEAATAAAAAEAATAAAAEAAAEAATAAAAEPATEAAAEAETAVIAEADSTQAMETALTEAVASDPDAMAVDEPKPDEAAAATEVKPDVPVEEAPVEPAAAAAAEGPPGEVAAAEETTAASEAAAEVAPSVMPVVMVTEEDIKMGWMRSRDLLYTATAAELESRRLFEELIKRSYFHVKPLDASQLTNWLKYLDYIEGKGNAAAAMILYERCLVPCASYPEFWERYVRWLEKQGMNDEAAHAVKRATSTFCRNRPEIHLFAMHFDERSGAVESARKRYKLVLGELAPRLLSATTAAANFEKRQGDREAACQLYELLMKEERAKDDGASKSTLPFLAMHYANFLRVAYKDHAKGRKVLHDALAVTPNMKQLWEAAIFYEETTAAEDMVRVVLELCERASAPSGATAEAGKPNAHLPDKDREDFSLRALELADAHGTTSDLLAAERKHSANFALPTNVASEGRKRHAEAAAADAVARPAKAARPDAAPAAAVLPAGYHGYLQPAAPAAAAYPGYYGQYPGYPPAAAPGYPPAAAYPGQYPGYGYGY